MTTRCISIVLHLQPFLHQNADVAQDDAPVLTLSVRVFASNMPLQHRWQAYMTTKVFRYCIFAILWLIYLEDCKYWYLMKRCVINFHGSPSSGSPVSCVVV